MRLEEFIEMHGFVFERYEHRAVMTVAGPKIERSFLDVVLT